MQASTNRKFELCHFQKMLSVQHGVYTYNWNKLTGSHEYKLFVDIPDQNVNDEVLEHRHKVFKSELIRITANAHREHMRAVAKKKPDEAEALREYDPFRCKSWHWSFDPHSSRFVTSIEQATIAQRPERSRSESVSEYLKRTRSSSKKESMSGTRLQLSNYNTCAAASNALDMKCAVSKEKAPTAKLKTPDVLAEMFARIEQKEKVYKKEQEQAELQRKNNRCRILEDKLVRLCDSIKSMFAVLRLRVIRKNKLIQDLSDSQRG